MSEPVTNAAAAAESNYHVAERLPEGTRPFGLVGYFDTPGELYEACEELRDAGFKMDAHTPFPVHGLEKAMGVGPSRLPYIVLAGGIIGGLAIFLLMWWVDNVEYAQNISGKPHFAWQAYVPVTFEITVLLSAFGAFFGLWGLNKLPQFLSPGHAAPRLRPRQRRQILRQCRERRAAYRSGAGPRDLGQARRP